MSSESQALLLDVSRQSPEDAVEELIERAVAMGASDLFLVANEQHTAVQVRNMGMIELLSILTPEHARRCTGYLKTHAQIDLTERRRPLDGRWIYPRGEEGDVDVRINVIPTLYGEDFALRLFPRGRNLYSIAELGMTRQQQTAYETMIGSPGGLILISGPMGSGKTSTLYATLSHLNNGKRKINTIENPVEYAIAGIRQSQVNETIDLGFSELLRGVLRQAPDVVMIGEIRDEETARTAVHAANSGVLVLATVHAPSAAEAVQSMRSLGVNAHFLAQSLRGVVSQRLVRRLDQDHRIEFDLTDAPHTFDDVRKWLGPGEGNILYAPQPDAANHMTGYIGQTGIFELLEVTRTIRELISDHRPVQEIRDQAEKDGMLRLGQAAMVKVARGLTSTEEVFRVVPSEHLLER